MSETHTLQVTERDNTINPRQLRTAGFIPATLYGKGIASQSIQVRTIEVTRLLHHGARQFDLVGLGAPVQAKVHQIQTNPVSLEILSLEFLQLSPQSSQGNAKPASRNESETPALAV